MDSALPWAVLTMGVGAVQQQVSVVKGFAVLEYLWNLLMVPGVCSMFAVLPRTVFLH